MKKIFCLLLFVVSFTAVMAQSKNQQEEKPALEQRVDSLQHELAFLKAEYELDQFNSEIYIKACNVDTRTNSIDLNRVRRIFDSNLAVAYQSYYEAIEGLAETFKKRADSLKHLIVLQLMQYSFSDSETELLKSKIKTLDLELNSLDKNLDLYKTSLDEYKKRCLE